jgi:hypothetical protein
MGRFKIKAIALTASLLASFLPTAKTLAGSLHVRAREHYETMKVSTDGGEASFLGFTNTINGWYEEPFHYSIGLAGSPLLATLASKAPPPGFGDKIRLVHLGIEGKIFPVLDIAGFTRMGVYQSTLSSLGLAGHFEGMSILIGLGYEFDVHGVGIAPEMSWRRGNLSHGASFDGQAPAIGVHFYQAI